MKTKPSDIIAITIRRYLNSPQDKLFWERYLTLKEPTPKHLLTFIEEYIDMDYIFSNPLLEGDKLLIEYLRIIDFENGHYPINEYLLAYEKKWFTLDDNDFYNRTIYEKEIEKLKEDNKILHEKLDEAIKAKNDFVMRDYELIKSLGDGGFGIVSLVRHKLSDTLFAIKRLHSKSTTDQENILREISALAPLTHPNVIRYQHGFNANGLLYLVMEYCSGGSLYEKLQKEKRLNEEKLVEIFLLLTKAFSYLHRKGIIHHDIKPSNILIDADDNYKISDFGCINTSMGTPPYIAPELCSDPSLVNDSRTDIFSLGVTLMECALGFNPFQNKMPNEKTIMLKQASLPLQHLPYWLQDIIYKAVSIDINTRFQTMDEFHNALVQKNIPKILTLENIEFEQVASRLNMLVKTKKWNKAGKFISFYPKIEQNLNLLINTGTYFLKTHQLEKARYFFEKALWLNPNAGIEKQIAEVYLQSGETNKAITILANYINRNFGDLEAQNQLLYAYFISGRWELGFEQADLLTNIFPKESIVINNYNLFCILAGHIKCQVLDACYDLSFTEYNNSVYSINSPMSWLPSGEPKLKSKLLFQEYKFREIAKSQNAIELKISETTYRVTDPIISFGRKDYNYNSFCQFEGNSISRRHFVIVNMKDNVWIYDLNSATGVYVDECKVNQKAFILGLHSIKFGNSTIELKSDIGKLI